MIVSTSSRWRPNPFPFVYKAKVRGREIYASFIVNDRMVIMTDKAGAPLRSLFGEFICRRVNPGQRPTAVADADNCEFY